MIRPSLAIGHWLYVPEDVTDSVNYEFGVFASGGDPFEASYLAALTGTATYLGDALGMYYVDGLSSSPTVGSFTADAILTADFGDDSETGFISGEVNNFVFEDDVASSLPATVNLTSDPYSYLSANFGVAEDSTNIFDTNWSGDAAPYPGGHIAAEATASADGHNWYGEWHAAFYGNGLATTDIPPSYVEHPTSVAGTFNVSTYDDNKRVDSGLAGSFGAHRYDDGLTRGDPSNLANAIDLIADNGRQDDQGNYISAWTWANWGVGAQQAAANHTYREGSHANVIVFHDENEELQFNVAIVKNDTAPLLQETPVWVQAHQYLETEEIGQTLEGVTRFMRPVMDHDLGSGWQVAELTNDYDNGGTLTINIATDLEVAGMSENPFAGPSQYGRSIILDDVPDIPAGKDFVVAWINNGESITGTLDGVAGAFSCANPEGCSFFDDVQEGDFYPASEDVTFVPDDGSGDVPLPISFGVPVDTANYLAFGNWLYVPEDVTDMDAYDFGVFASGGDPFVAAYIEQQTDVFTYAGDATGVYYANESSPSPDIGSFSADVELIADFGTTSEFGTVTGELRNFAFAGEGSSVFPTTVALTKNIYDDFVTGFGVQQGQTNIFVGDNPYNALSQPGGWIEGLTSASTQAGSWWGRWGGKFYGRGLESLDIPPSYVEPPQSIGGVFGLYNGDNGLAGSFGAHRQDDQ